MAISVRTRKRDGVKVYYIDFRDSNGARIREQAGYSRRAALRMLQKRLGEASEGTLDRNRLSDTPLRDFVKVFMERHATTCEQPDWYEYLTGKLVTEFGDTPLRHLNVFRIQGYVNRITARDDEGRIVNAQTVGHVRRTMVNLLARAKEWGYLSGDNPASGVKGPRAPESRQRWLTRDEAGAVVAKCTGDLGAMVRLMLHTALRSGEAKALQWADVLTSERKLVVRKSKTGKARIVPLNDEALAALAGVKVGESPYVFPGLDGGQRKSIRTAFMGACKRAGLKHGIRDRDGVTLHTLRHTAISWMLQAGAPPFAVSKIAGHSAAGMTERYAHFDDGHLLAAVQRMVTPVDTRQNPQDAHAPQVVENAGVGA